MKDKMRPSINATQLCQVLTNDDESPLSIHEQKDADEFLQLLNRHLEEELAKTSRPKLWHEIFGGHFVNEIVSLDCPHRSERLEDFYSLSVVVAGKHHLQEGLSGIVESEALEGDNSYLCQHCNKRVRANKRVTIGLLPNTLVIVLKRLEFNLQTG